MFSQHVFDLKKNDLFEMVAVNLTTRDDSRVGCGSTGGDWRNLGVPGVTRNHTVLINLHYLLEKWTLTV